MDEDRATETPEPGPEDDRAPISGRGIMAALVAAILVLFLGIFVISWVLFMP